MILLVLLGGTLQLGNLVSQLLVIGTQLSDATGIIRNLAALLGIISGLFLLLGTVMSAHSPPHQQENNNCQNR